MSSKALLIAMVDAMMRWHAPRADVSKSMPHAHATIIVMSTNQSAVNGAMAMAKTARRSSK
ncbi:uncharacterized protein RCO7_14178 [Rhynchosporium graminicola]|uniref:Uncharacterized protein n=1 Tax=Rhynchosporium graminicola TaxID=2792576 RepID=A0A1E1JWQ2_9HELO|nr:uncharacterized protein RCO7_14178 [Rhynchosporium commune]